MITSIPQDRAPDFTMRHSIDTPRGKRSVHGNIRQNGSIAKSAGNAIRAAKSLNVDANDQLSTASSRIKGSKTDAPVPKSSSRETRKELARKGSLVLEYSFFKDPGYTEPPKSSSDLAVLKNINFLDKYRNSQFRPLEGKDGYPIASIQVLSRSKGSKAGGKGFKTILPAFTKFFLESVQFQSSEKYQLALTFRSFRLFFFDANPEIWTFSGHLMNTENENWLTEFRELYRQFLRGTQCAKRNSQCFMTFQDQAVGGVLLNTGSSLQAVSDKGVPFSFSLLVYNDASISSNALSRISQQLSYPKGSKNSPPVLFEIMRKDFARKYGSKERRGGGLVVTSAIIEKFGTKTPAIKSANDRKPTRAAGR